MAAGLHNITIEQGATFELNLRYTDANGAAIPLTGWTARMQVRATHASPSPALDLPGADGTITLDSEPGLIVVTVPADVTAALPLYGKASAAYVYDLEIAETATGRVKKLLKGTATIEAEVTK